MSTPVHSAALLLLLLASASGQDASTPPAAPKTGKHYAVHCHGGSEVMAEQALDVVERVWPIVAAALGSPGVTPKQPLAVHLYRTIAGYEAAEQELTQGKFRRNLAMSDWNSKSAHVALQPPCSDEALRAIGLPGMTVALLAWEAAHLARFELCSNFRDHPMWFADGLAASAASQVLESVYPSGDAWHAQPFVTNDLVRVQQLQQQKKLPPASAILADRIDDLDFGDRYAARAVFFQFLQTGTYRGRFGRVVQAVRDTRTGPAYKEAVLAAVDKVLGSALERDFTRHVQDAKPRWREVYRSLTTHGKQWHQIAFPDKNAIAWHEAPVKGGKLFATGSLRLLPGEARQLNLLFGRTEAGFYSVAFVAEAGFTLFRYDAQKEQWHKLGAGNAPALRLGYSIAFSVESNGKDLVVRLGEQSWDFKLPNPLPAEVYWGVGAQAGSAGIWTDVTVKTRRD